MPEIITDDKPIDSNVEVIDPDKQEPAEPMPKSPLGEDLPGEKVPAPAPKADATVPDTRVVTQEEYSRLVNSDATVRMIENDPVLAQQVIDHFNHKTKEIPAPAAPTTKKEGKPVDPTSTEGRLDALEAENKALREQNVAVQVAAFEEKHPDMASAGPLRQRMGELCTQHNLSLNDAYNLAKSDIAKDNATSGGKDTAVHPTTEGKGGSEPTASEGEDARAEVLKKINDPKATKSMDEALELAWEASKQLSE